MVRFLSIVALLLAARAAMAQSAVELPVQTTVCELLKNPKAWDHKLVQVSGTASHGFEDSAFTDKTCGIPWPPLWMSYGGKRQTGTISTANEHDRIVDRSMKVEGVDIPLLDDATFEQFDTLLHPEGMPGKPSPSATVRAKVVARFFAGRLQHFPAGDVWGGYGHLGCCSLFVIHQVLSVDGSTVKVLRPEPYNPAKPVLPPYISP